MAILMATAGRGSAAALFWWHGGQYRFYRLPLCDAAPTLIAWGDGYKLGVSVATNRLVVSNALYNGWEPNCCASGRSYDTYRLSGKTLVLVSARTEGFPEMQVETVRHFYQLLQERDFAAAYALLSDSYQAANPFAAWEAGYANTVDFTFTVAPGASGSNRVFLSNT